jgi:hypothetical protein
VPCRALCRVFAGNEPLDAFGDGCSVLAQRMLPDGGLKNDDPFAPHPLALLSLLFIQLDERVVGGLRRAIQIIVFRFLGGLGEDGVNEGIFVGAARTPSDDVEGDFNGAFQFDDGLLEV